jgi:hypothetical protein
LDRPHALHASPTARRALDALAILLCLGAAAFALQRLRDGDCQYVVWSDRDLARSQVDLLSLPATGPELSTGSGTRVPGGAFHALLWVADQLSPGPRAAWRLQVGLDALAALVIGLSVRARVGWIAAAVSASVFLTLGPNVINQQPLWNPAWLSLFVAAATVAWVRVLSDGDARGLVVWAVSLALGAQMHVTALVLGAVMLPSLVRARPRGAARGWVLAGVGVLAAYGPYLASEAAHGWPNTRLMAEGGGGHAWLTLPYFLSIVTALRALTGDRPLDLLQSQGPAWAVWGVAAIAPLTVLAGSVSLLRERSPRVEVTRALAGRLAAVCGVLLLLICTSDEFDFVRSNNSRYLLVLAGPLSWLAGLAADRAVTVAGRRQAALGLLVALALTVSMGERLLASSAFAVEARASRGCLATQAWLDDAALKLGTSRADVARGAVVLTHEDRGRWSREVAMPVDALLGPERPPFGGSTAPPCVAILPDFGPDRRVQAQISVADLQRAIGPDTPVERVLDQVPLDGGVWMVRYATSRARCPSNMTQRYVLTPEERLTEQLGPTAPPDAATALAPDGGASRWMVRLDAAHGRFSPPWDVLALLTATRHGDVITWTLHSNQLRGHAWNAGFFRDARVIAPTLVATGADGAPLGQLALADGPVGGDGALTPLSADATWPTGAKVALRVQLEPSAVGNAGLQPGALVTQELALPGGAP